MSSGTTSKNVTTINMLSAIHSDGPAFNTRSRTTQQSSSKDSTPQTDAIAPDVTDTQNTTPISLSADRLEALLWMQKMDPFCKHISNQLSNGKAPRHEADLFIHVQGLLYKHVTDSHQKYLALVILKAWKYTVLVEAHDKLGHQGSTWTYCLIKHQYCWKGKSKDIRKYIAQCAHCHIEKAKVQAYPLQMTEIPEFPFDKIAIDLVTECEASNSVSKHILTIIGHLTGWPQSFPIPDKSADTIVSTFINQCLPVHMCLMYILSDNGTDLKKTPHGSSTLTYLEIEHIFSEPYHPQSNGKLETFHKYLKHTLRNLYEKDSSNWDKYIIPSKAF